MSSLEALSMASSSGQMGLNGQALLLLGALFLSFAFAPRYFWAWLYKILPHSFSSSPSAAAAVYRGPRRWPIVGAYFEVAANMHRLHDWVTDYCRQFRTFELHRGAFNMIHTVDPANVEYILKTNFQNYPKGEKPHEIQYELLGDGIFNSDGNTWKRHRKIASYEFSSRKLRDFSSHVFQKNSIKLANMLDSVAESKQEVELQDLFMRLALDSICEFVFGRELGALSPMMPTITFADAFDDVSEMIFKRNLSTFWRIKRDFGLGFEKQLRSNIRQIDAFIYGVIQQRKKLIQGSDDQDEHNALQDLLSRFMSFRGDDEKDEYLDKDLRDSVLNFVIAGRDTTASALSWFVYLLCINPDAVRKINDELDRILTEAGDGKKSMSVSEFCEHLTYDRLQEMHYLHACLNETLRLYPSVPRDSKVALRDDVLPDGTKVKAGDKVLYIPYAMGRMEFLWGEDALQFKPERWIKDHKVQVESPYKFTAFQAGPRICLGRDLAYLQLKIVAAVLTRFFHFDLVPTHKVQYRLTITLQMINGIKVFVSRRPQ